MNEASYLNQVANLKRFLVERDVSYEQAIDRYARMLLDTTTDETVIEELAKQVLDPKWVDGDSFGVPGPIDIVERLVGEIKRLREAGK